MTLKEERKKLEKELRILHQKTAVIEAKLEKLKEKSEYYDEFESEFACCGV